MVFRICQTLTISERQACRVLEPVRSSERRNPHVRDEEERLVTCVIELVTQYGRHGYRSSASGTLDGDSPEVTWSRYYSSLRPRGAVCLSLISGHAQ